MSDTTGPHGIRETVQLATIDGAGPVLMPRFGLGVYECDGQECYNSVLWALEAGYRLIDSAEWYGNEADAGRAIKDFMKKSGTARSDIFYTTKVMRNLGEKHVKAAIRKSLERAGLDYIDLYLIHGPQPDRKARLASWRAIEEAVQLGLVRAGGVSNFGVKHLQEMYATEGGLKVPIAVNQIDLHPFMRRNALEEYCQSKGIVMEAWGSMVRGLRFKHPALQKAAKKHGKSTAQVLLRWGLQKGYVVIPKSVKKQRVQENMQVFDFNLGQEDMESLENLDEHLITDWDPSEGP